MKKNILKSTLVVAALTITGYGGVKTYGNYSKNQTNGLVTANVEALASTADSSGGIRCYCTQHLFQKDVCTSNANGSQCAVDVQQCSDFDGNCRS